MKTSLDIQKWINKYIRQINESEDDDFNVIAGDEWSAQELKIRDIITPDMWTKEAKENNVNSDIDFNQNFRIVSIDYVNDLRRELMDPYFTAIDKEGDIYMFLFSELDPKKAYISNPLNENESDDDFIVTAGNEWNVKELNIGDIITPDMWDTDIEFGKNITNKIMNPENKIVIEDIDNNYGTIHIEIYDKKNKFIDDDWFWIEWLDPKKAYISPDALTESDKDDFNVVAGKEWNVSEINVGDYYNEMTGKIYRKGKDLPPPNSDRSRFIYKITHINSVNNSSNVYVESYYLGTRNIFSYAINIWNKVIGSRLNAYIPESLNELDDDFNVTSNDEWGAQELNVGDIITPDMWDVYYIKRSGFGDSKDEVLNRMLNPENKVIFVGIDNFYKDLYRIEIYDKKNKFISKHWVWRRMLNPKKAYFFNQFGN